MYGNNILQWNLAILQLNTHLYNQTICVTVQLAVQKGPSLRVGETKGVVIENHGSHNISSDANVGY